MRASAYADRQRQVFEEPAARRRAGPATVAGVPMARNIATQKQTGGLRLVGPMKQFSGLVVLTVGRDTIRCACVMTSAGPVMHRNGLKVCIIGAGTGGLCLAQGLKQDHVEVEVYERDHSLVDRLQGYRLSINATGSRALQACLPERLFEKLVANGAKPSESVAFLDHRLNRLLVI